MTVADKHMATRRASRLTRKTRIVCISDTHGQTPKLPRGDVLIHAGDLTNQGGVGELRRSVEWLEKADFEVKIVVAGNHDITLDAPFFQQHGSKWRYPMPQDTEECRKLLTQSKHITYLEHQAATIHLTSSRGPQTSFTVFGSPYSPRQPSTTPWAFQYAAEAAPELWECIPADTDIVVTHTPPRGVCDKATKDEREGCEALLYALCRTRPLVSICGHIHEARGVQRVMWNDYDSLTQMAAENGRGSPVRSVEAWDDPGAGQGNRKQSLVNLCGEGKIRRGQRRTLGDDGLTAWGRESIGAGDGGEEMGCGGQPGVLVPVPRVLQPDVLKSTSPALDSEAREGEDEEDRGKEGEGEDEERKAEAVSGGAHARDDVGRFVRSESVVVNAAFLGPRIQGKTLGTNKAIVVDVDLPVWQAGEKMEKETKTVVKSMSM